MSQQQIYLISAHKKRDGIRVIDHCFLQYHITELSIGCLRQLFVGYTQNIFKNVDLGIETLFIFNIQALPVNPANVTTTLIDSESIVPLGIPYKGTKVVSGIKIFLNVADALVQADSRNIIVFSSSWDIMSIPFGTFMYLMPMASLSKSFQIYSAYMVFVLPHLYPVWSI